MKLSVAITYCTFAACLLDSVVGTCSGIVKKIDFSQDADGNPLVVCFDPSWLGECRRTSQCQSLYPGQSNHDCVNNLNGDRPRMCFCGTEVCGCEGNGLGLASDISFPEGMTVSGVTGGKTNRVVLFDSNNPTGNDDDLAVGIGNLLILNQHWRTGFPDDTRNGGKLTLHFEQDVNMDSFLYVDLDGSETGTVKAYDANNNVLQQKTLPYVGNGNVGAQDFEQQNVRKVDIEFSSSGALGEVRLCIPDTDPKQPPGVFGDPHFVTWEGELFDYHGICDLLFLQSAANNLQVNIRTEKKLFWSFVSAAVVQINDDIFEFGSWGQVIANGVYLYDDEELPTSIGGHPLTLTTSNKKTHAYTIDMGDGASLEIKSYKDMVSVRPLGNHTKFSDSRGLMGSPVSGKKLGRDGDIWVESMNAYGQEWQVRADEPMLFLTAQEPQAPALCGINADVDKRPRFRRRLGEAMSREEAEEACQKWTMNKEACIGDVMMTGDKDVAHAFEY